MWNPFKNIMRLVTFLLLIQMDNIIAKVIKSPRSCNDSPENDPQLKRSDETYSDIADTTATDADVPDTRKMISKPNTDNEYDKLNDFAANPNTLPQNLALVNTSSVPINSQKGDIIVNKITTTKAPLQQTIYYKAIDPKYIIVSGLSLPKPNKNMTNVSTTEVIDNDVKETIPLHNSNLTEETNVLNKYEGNYTEGKEILINDLDADVTNIRELREHLLDHLLDYFLNIIKEENFLRNDTRKKNGKDRMKVEEKLRNYYDPHHLDTLLVDNDDYDDNNLDDFYYPRNNDSEEDLLDNVEQNEEIGKNNITVTLNTLVDDIDKNKGEVHRYPTIFKKEPEGQSVSVNLTEPIPVTSNSNNIVEKQNNSIKTLSNTTEKFREAFDNNVITLPSKEISISNEILNDEVDNAGPTNHSDEVVTDRIEYVYDSGALTLDDYSNEGFIDSDEVQVIRNVNLHEDDGSPIAITTENGRRQIVADKVKHNANNALNETKNANNNYQNLRNGTINSSSKDGVLLLGRQNTYNEHGVLDNPKNFFKKDSKQDRRKLRSNRKCGKLVSKLNNINTNKHRCRNSIILHLNINII